MPKTTRLEVSDGSRTSNIKTAVEVDACDFFSYTTETQTIILQKAGEQPDATSVAGWDMTTASFVLVPNEAEVDVIEEVKVVTIND